MGTTANYSWPYPESSDYVADGATAIENLADAADTTTKSVSDAAAAAQSTANTAVSNAAAAQSTANTAVSDAAAAQSTANTAVSNAAAAQSTANTANTLAVDGYSRRTRTTISVNQAPQYGFYWGAKAVTRPTSQLGSTWGVSGIAGTSSSNVPTMVQLSTISSTSVTVFVWSATNGTKDLHLVWSTK